jgi:hypothetical protein
MVSATADRPSQDLAPRLDLPPPPDNGARRFRFSDIDLNLPAVGCDQRQAPRPGLGILFGNFLGTALMESVRPDDANSTPLRRSQQGMGRIMIRFVGLLLVAVVVLALIWSR